MPIPRLPSGVAVWPRVHNACDGFRPASCLTSWRKPPCNTQACARAGRFHAVHQRLGLCNLFTVNHRKSQSGHRTGACLWPRCWAEDSWCGPRIRTAQPCSNGSQKAFHFEAEPRLQATALARDSNWPARPRLDCVSACFLASSRCQNSIGAAGTAEAPVYRRRLAIQQSGMFVWEPETLRWAGLVTASPLRHRVLLKGLARDRGERCSGAVACGRGEVGLPPGSTSSHEPCRFCLESRPEFIACDCDCMAARDCRVGMLPS